MPRMNALVAASLAFLTAVVGFLSALALAGHSFLDGLGIGFAFQVSAGTGVMVALAVLAHDFADGMNTVSLMLVVRLPPEALAVYLGVFGGFLLYIGAADILPEAHSGRSSPWAIALTCLGAFAIYCVTQALH
jgi:zinc transporter ZupT